MVIYKLKSSVPSFPYVKLNVGLKLKKGIPECAGVYISLSNIHIQRVRAALKHY